MLYLKRFFARLLTSHYVCSALERIFSKSIPSLKFRHLRISNDRSIPKETKSSFFFGLYESGELRMIDQYVSCGRQVLELGASIGVVASFVGRFKRPLRHIVVEANPSFIPIIQKNLNLNDVRDVTILNYAIAGEDEKLVWFKAGELSTAGTVDLEYSPGAVSVGALSLSSTERDFGLKDYLLICDIEGSEYEFIKSGCGLSGCSDIIIELHEVMREERVVSIGEMLALLLKQGFRVVAHDGPVYYLKS